MCVRYLAAGPLSRSYKWESGQRKTHRQQGDIISLILYFRSRGKKMGFREDLRNGRVTDTIPNFGHWVSFTLRPL
jgi:hypothetical protein